MGLGCLSLVPQVVDTFVTRTQKTLVEGIGGIKDALIKIRGPWRGSRRGSQ